MVYVALFQLSENNEKQFISLWHKILPQYLHIYRLHPKDREGTTVFSLIVSSHPGGGWSTPIQLMGGGGPSQVLDGGYPHPAKGGLPPSNQGRVGVPISRSVWVTPPPQETEQQSEYLLRDGR